MTADDVRALLRSEIEKAGTAKAWAKRYEISTTLVSDTVSGRRDPSFAIMKALGLTRETLYYRAAQ